MKDLIIAVGLILLGCILFDLIAGDGDSLRAVSGAKMSDLLQMYRGQIP